MKILRCKKSWETIEDRPEYGLRKGENYKVLIEIGDYLSLAPEYYDFGSTAGILKEELKEYFYCDIILSSNIKVI